MAVAYKKEDILNASRGARPLGTRGDPSSDHTAGKREREENRHLGVVVEGATSARCTSKINREGPFCLTVPYSVRYQPE